MIFLFLFFEGLYIYTEGTDLLSWIHFQYTYIQERVVKQKEKNKTVLYLKMENRKPQRRKP